MKRIMGQVAERRGAVLKAPGCRATALVRGFESRPVPPKYHKRGLRMTVVRTRTERGRFRAARESVRPMASGRRPVKEARIFSGLRSNPPGIGRSARKKRTATRYYVDPATEAALVAEGRLGFSDGDRHK